MEGEATGGTKLVPDAAVARGMLPLATTSPRGSIGSGTWMVPRLRESQRTSVGLNDGDTRANSLLAEDKWFCSAILGLSGDAPQNP